MVGLVEIKVKELKAHRESSVFQKLGDSIIIMFALPEEEFGFAGTKTFGSVWCYILLVSKSL